MDELRGETYRDSECGHYNSCCLFWAAVKDTGLKKCKENCKYYVDKPPKKSRRTGQCFFWSAWYDKKKQYKTKPLKEKDNVRGILKGKKK